MAIKLPEPDINTANHAGVRVKAYSDHAVREILASQEKEANERIELLIRACERLMGSLNVMIGNPADDGDTMFAKTVIAHALGKPAPHRSRDDSDSWYVQDTSKNEGPFGEWLTVGPNVNTTNIDRASICTRQQALELIESGRGTYSMWPTRYVRSHSYYTLSKQEFGQPTRVIESYKLDRLKRSHYERNKQTC